MNAVEDICAWRAEIVRGLTDRQCGKRRLCYLCGGPLPKLARWWCSSKCVDLWSRNHEWTAARAEALIRSAALSDRWYDGFADHLINWARCDQCAADVHAAALEVNHVEPRNGGGYSRGCWNHQTNLQVLCHACHVKETKRQTVERPVYMALKAGLITAERAQELIDANMAYMGRAARKKAGLPRLPSTPTPGFRRGMAS
jgi:hypothetical protein